MLTSLQKALNEGFGALEREAGVWFTTKAGLRFIAWPVQSPLAVAGRIDASPDTSNYFESRATVAFERSEVLKGPKGLSFTVANRSPFNPSTGTFRFAVHSGRAVK